MTNTKIKSLRTKAEIDTKQAIKELGISYSMLTKIETHLRNPSAKLISRMSKVYKCSTDAIYEALKEKEVDEC